MARAAPRMYVLSPIMTLCRNTGWNPCLCGWRGTTARTHISQRERGRGVPFPSTNMSGSASVPSSTAATAKKHGLCGLSCDSMACVFVYCLCVCGDVCECHTLCQCSCGHKCVCVCVSECNLLHARAFVYIHVHACVSVSACQHVFVCLHVYGCLHDVSVCDVLLLSLVCADANAWGMLHASILAYWTLQMLSLCGQRLHPPSGA